MTRPLRHLSVLLFVAALAALATLLASDGLHGLRLTLFHQRAGALALILIGSSYIARQLGLRRRWQEALQGIFLGGAFVLWGSEQFLPPGPVVTAIDSAVITIFVVDLSLIIVGQIRSKGPDTKTS
jgi:hypothetical protein